MHLTYLGRLQELGALAPDFAEPNPDDRVRDVELRIASLVQMQSFTA